MLGEFIVAFQHIVDDTVFGCFPLLQSFCKSGIHGMSSSTNQTMVWPDCQCEAATSFELLYVVFCPLLVLGIACLPRLSLDDIRGRDSSEGFRVFVGCRVDPKQCMGDVQFLMRIESHEHIVYLERHLLELLSEPL